MERRTFARPKIGLYGVGLQKYWSQFEGLEERLKGYLDFLEGKMAQFGEVYKYGLVDERKKAVEAGEWFNSKHVDIIFCYSATYARSGDHIALPQIAEKPIVVLNLQPAAQINYEMTTTGEWLAHCGSCGVPEIANVFARAGIEFNLVNGLLGMHSTPDISMTDENTADHPAARKAWAEIEEWIAAAKVLANLQRSTFAFLGHTYSGMLDLYTDFTALTAVTGSHIEILELCDLQEKVDAVTEEEVLKVREKTEEIFEISKDSPADPLARKPSERQLNWACRVAAGLERLVVDRDLDAIAYFYQGANENQYEKIQEAMILGNSLLTAAGIPCAGEGDIKTAVAMKIADILGLGGSFCEVVVNDYKNQTILMGHDGPFHLDIAEQKPILRGLGIYHGKEGSGVSVEAKVKKGAVTNLGIAEAADGTLRMLISKGESVDGEIMQIGNTMTPISFAERPDTYMDRWFQHGPIHHFALSMGDNVQLFKKVARLLSMEAVII